MKLRYATREDLIQWFGKIPATTRAISIVDGERVLGVAGVSRMGDHMQAWSAFKEDLRDQKMVLGRAAVMFGRLVSEYESVVAVCSKTEPTAPGLLAHLGFQPDGEVWRYG